MNLPRSFRKVFTIAVLGAVPVSAFADLTPKTQLVADHAREIYDAVFLLGSQPYLPKSSEVMAVMEQAKNTLQERSDLIEANRRLLAPLKADAAHLAELAQKAKFPESKNAYLKIKSGLDQKIADQEKQMNADLALEAHVQESLAPIAVQLQDVERKAAKITDVAERRKFILSQRDLIQAELATGTPGVYSPISEAQRLMLAAERNATYHAPYSLQLVSGAYSDYPEFETADGKTQVDDQGHLRRDHLESGIASDMMKTSSACGILLRHYSYALSSDDQISPFNEVAKAMDLDLKVVEFAVSGKNGENKPIRMNCEPALWGQDVRLSYNAAHRELNVRFDKDGNAPGVESTDVVDLLKQAAASSAR